MIDSKMLCFHSFLQFNCFLACHGFAGALVSNVGVRLMLVGGYVGGTNICFYGLPHPFHPNEKERDN